MKYNLVEFFVGAGGSHLGFMQEGFATLYANDFDSNALQTLEFNNKKHLKNAILDSTDITQICPKELNKKLNSSVDVMFGGIVCKGFSLAGERSPADERNQFYRYYLDIVKELRPKISIIENVKGMLNARILNPSAPKKLLDKVDKLWQELENFKGKKSQLRKENNITQKVLDYGLRLREQKQDLLEQIKLHQISVLDDIYQIYEKMGYKVQHKILNAV